MNFIKFGVLNSSSGASFALVKKFGNNRLKSSFIPNFFTNTKLPLQNTRIFNLDSATRTQIAESRLDSANQNISSLRDSASQNRGNPPIKKMQNLQGGLPRRFCESARNDKSILDSAKSQNLVNLNPRVSANLETRPLRGAKNRNQGCRSATADFLLEADKRGSPPKSEKRQLLGNSFKYSWGERERRGAALLREETSEISSKGGAESTQESQGGLPRRFCESARNDEFLDSSLRKCFAQNDKTINFAESSLDSANQNISSLRDSAKQNRGNPKDLRVLRSNQPPIEKAQDLQGGLPRRFCESARNDKSILDSAKSQNLVKNGVRVAESTLDSAIPKQEANSAIADEFLGFCEASDKDRTLVHRGSEPKQPLKSRCESEFAPKFDKDDFYFLLVTLASLLSLIYLISGASVSYKEAILLRENSATIAKIANLSLAHFSHILGLDFSAKLPNLIFHTLNLALIYLISNKILKFKRDSVLCVAVYALIPGVIMQGGIINESIIALFMVLVICYAELTKRLFIYPLCVLAVFLGESALMLFLALCFYFAIKKCVKSALFALACLLANIYIYGIDISGAPRGNFLGVFSELALLYSPALFVYFIYAIYRNFAKGGANLLLYISGISIVTSVILSVRQDVDKEIYMFMSLCGIPLAIKQFLSGLRLRLPSFQLAYKRQFLVIAIILIFETFLLIFSKQIYKVSNDENLFLNQFYIAKEVASELKARNISRVQVEGRMQERLAFYGIKEGGQKLRRVKKGGNVVVEYYGKIIARYAI